VVIVANGVVVMVANGVVVIVVGGAIVVHGASGLDVVTERQQVLMLHFAVQNKMREHTIPWGMGLKIVFMGHWNVAHVKGAVVVDGEGDGVEACVVVGQVVDIVVSKAMQHLSLSREQQACGYLHNALPAPGLV